MAGLFGGIFGGAGPGAGGAAGPPGATAPTAVTVTQLNAALFQAGPAPGVASAGPLGFDTGGVYAASTMNVAVRARSARTSGDQLFNVPAHLQF